MRKLFNKLFGLKHLDMLIDKEPVAKPTAKRRLSAYEKFRRSQNKFIAKMNENFRSRQIARRLEFKRHFKEVSQEFAEPRLYRRRIARARMHAQFRLALAAKAIGA